MARIIFDDLPKNQNVSDEDVKMVFGESGQTEPSKDSDDLEHSGNGCGCGCS